MRRRPPLPYMAVRNAPHSQNRAWLSAHREKSYGRVSMLLWQDRYLRLDIDATAGLVRQTRSALSYEDVTTLLVSINALVQGMHMLQRSEYALLQDMRAARGRNDPQFESAITREGARMRNGFRKVAVLVASHVGRLQVQRYLDGHTLTARAFLDEAEALAWLNTR